MYYNILYFIILYINLLVLFKACMILFHRKDKLLTTPFTFAIFSILSIASFVSICTIVHISLFTWILVQICRRQEGEGHEGHEAPRHEEEEGRGS